MQRFRQQLAPLTPSPGGRVPAPTMVARAAARAFRPTLPSRNANNLRLAVALQTLSAPPLANMHVAVSPPARDDRGGDEIRDTCPGSARWPSGKLATRAGNRMQTPAVAQSCRLETKQDETGRNRTKQDKRRPAADISDSLGLDPLAPARKRVSPFAPRKQRATFAERKATIRQLLIRRSLATSSPNPTLHPLTRKEAIHEAYYDA